MFVYKHVTFKHTKPEIKDIFNHTLSIIVNLGRLFVIFMGIFTCQLTICYQCILSLPPFLYLKIAGEISRSLMMELVKYTPIHLCFSQTQFLCMFKSFRFKACVCYFHLFHQGKLVISPKSSFRF